MKLYLVFIVIVRVSQISGDYIHYPNLNRKCIRYLNCPPGHEIVPCTVEFTNDSCTKCPHSLEQPDWISSTGDPSTTNCFKPTSECLSDELTYRRNPGEAFCNSLRGCKCKSLTCYYGDPCLCDHLDEECQKGHFMNDTGSCVKCPEGTEKNHKGCGPCKILSNINAAALDIRKTEVPLAIAVTSTEAPSSKGEIGALGNRGIPKTEDNTTLLILVAVLGFVLLVLFIIIVILVSRRAGFVMLSGICWTGNRHENRFDVEGNQHIQLEIAPLVPNQNRDVQQDERVKTEKENVITSPVSDNNPHIYPYIQEPRDSVSSSGFGGSDMSDSSSQELREDKNVKGKIKDKTPNNEDTSNVHVDASKNKKNAKTSLLHLDIEKSLFKTLLDYNLSESKSPVTEESEPPKFGTSDHVYRPGSAEDSCSQEDTSGYATYSIEGMSSGSYISMRVSDQQSFDTEVLPSGLENITFNMKDSNNRMECSDHQKEDAHMNHSTCVKHIGPASLSSVGGDSGIQSLL